MSKNLQSVNLRTIQVADLDAYVYSGWNSNGIAHYFFDSAVNAKDSSDLNALRQALGLKKIIALDQKHTNETLFYSAENISQNYQNIDFKQKAADSILIYDYQQELNLGLSLRTADCMPILVIGENIRGVIHIGWQGIVNQIALKFIEIAKKYTNQPIYFLVGPHALVDSYQFSKSDLEQFGPELSYKEEGSKCYLDLIQTLSNQLVDIDNITVLNSNICTIRNKKFNSYRRDRKKSHRNLSLLCI